MNQQTKKKKWKKILLPDGRFEFVRRQKHLKNKKETYDEWWNRKNLDGSFAYNGVTKDF
jgi:hypothetical protein